MVQFQEQLLNLGVEDRLASVCAESGAMDPLMDAYVDRMQATMQVNYLYIALLKLILYGHEAWTSSVSLLLTFLSVEGIVL